MTGELPETLQKEWHDLHSQRGNHISDEVALNCIQQILNGEPWDAGTSGEIANVVKRTGRPVCRKW